ncbi:MAG: peptide deformylase [Phycisphaerales bacterium]
MPVDPSKLRVVHYPDPVLRRKAADIVVTDEVRAVAQRMIELMNEEEGIGLAGPQVGLQWRIFVTRVPPSEKRPLGASPLQADEVPMVYINPVLSDPAGDLVPFEEGCLSLPEITGVVNRPDEITIRALNEKGEKIERRGKGLLARCWQHEFDHLDGVLILDRMTQIYRMKNRSAVRDLEAEWDANHGR